MASRLLALAGTVALTLGTLLVPAGPAAADPARCGGWAAPRDVYEGGYFSFRSVAFGGTPLHRGPYDDCQVVNVAFAGQGIDVHCYIVNQEFGTPFFYVRNTSTGYAGWAKIGEIIWNTGGPMISGCYQ